MHHVTSRDGTLIGYDQLGTGPPLLLVHGTSSNRTRWSAIAPRFAPHVSVYTLDRRGRGASRDAAPYDIHREAEDVAAVVDAVADATGAPAALLGHSYGAICSLEAALLTGNLRRLVLYEPPIPTGQPLMPLALQRQLQTLVDSGEPEAALDLFYREGPRVPADQIEAYRQLPIWQEGIDMAATLPREVGAVDTYRLDPVRFARLAIPTLLLLGGDSPPFFRPAIELVDAALPSSHIVVLPGQHHSAMDTAPELFAGEVLRFLQA
jgi:pimeloyl-ACP methyl ester carboxylesterase